MFNAHCSENCRQPSSLVSLEAFSQSAISHRSSPGALWRQCLIFECAPSISNARTGRGIALVELADGRVFFLLTSMAVLEAGEPMDSLVEELSKLPEWIINLAGAAEMVGFAVGAPLEFVGDDPRRIESWNIRGWKQHMASKLVASGMANSIKQISIHTENTADEIGTMLCGRIEEFMQAIDQPENWLYAHLRCSWQSAYNYLSPKDEKKKLYRRQANQTFPLFVQHMFLSPKDELTASILRAIDSGVPLVDFMAKLFNAPRKCIRHLNGLGLEDIGIQWKGRIKEFVLILAGLDVNRLPKGRHEWDVFGDTINLLLKMTKMPTTALSSRMLLSELSKLHWNRRHDISTSFEERALAIEHFAENIRRAVLATTWVNGKDASQAGGALQRLAAEAACSLGLSRLEKMSQKWRAEELQLDTALSRKSECVFPVILEPPLELGELKIVQLTDPSQLAIEGIRMSNCVGNYTGVCSSGHALIFSIRDKTNAPHVTIEYRLVRSSNGLPELHLVQQRGRGNEVPGSQYHGALQLLHRFSQSPQNRKKLLGLLIYQKAVERGGSDLAAKYSRSLEFIEFLEQAAPGKFDFKKMAEAAVS